MEPVKSPHHDSWQRVLPRTMVLSTAFFSRVVFLLICHRITPTRAQFFSASLLMTVLYQGYGSFCRWNYCLNDKFPRFYFPRNFSVLIYSCSIFFHFFLILDIIIVIIIIMIIISLFCLSSFQKFNINWQSKFCTNSKWNIIAFLMGLNEVTWSDQSAACIIWLFHFFCCIV